MGVGTSFTVAFLAFLLSATQLTTAPAGSTQNAGSITHKRALRVVLYPFIPDYADFALKIVTGFNSTSEGRDITIKPIDLSDNYYSADDGDYIGKTDADVYELDSVFLSDFISTSGGAPKIQKLPAKLIPHGDQFLANAVLGAKANGIWYGVPHWVCSDFLFYRTGDPAFNNVKTLADLQKIFAAPSRDNSLLVDLKGKSTLGELYLMSDIDRSADLASVYANIGDFDQGIERNLQRVRAMCEVDYCRNSDYHHRPGFYGRQFARHRGRALVGYSEILHDMISESAGSCTAAEKCLTDADVDVASLPLDDSGSKPMSWVDSFVVSSTCVKQCLADAIAFIQYASDERTVLRALLSDSNNTPRYLLPARTSVYSSDKLPHLYGKLRALIEGASAPSTKGLNSTLRQHGAHVDKDLGS